MRGSQHQFVFIKRHFICLLAASSSNPSRSVAEQFILLFFSSGEVGYRFTSLEAVLLFAVSAAIAFVISRTPRKFHFHLLFFNKFAGKDYEDKRPRDRYVAEARRLLGVLDKRLTDHTWITGDAYTIADIAIFPWVRNLIGFYEAGDLVGISDFPHATRALQTFLERSAVARGLNIPPRS
jgi:glutathione S-transferase